MQCFFCILVCLLFSLSSTIFYMIFSLFLLIVLLGHPEFLIIFSYFASLLFLNFHFLLILVCFVKFSIPSQCLFHFPLYCLSGVSLFTEILCIKTSCDGKISSNEIQWKIQFIATTFVLYEWSTCTVQRMPIYRIYHWISLEEILPSEHVCLQRNTITVLQYYNY